MEHSHALQLYGPAGVRYNVEAMARSDVQLMLDVKAGDDASFDLLLQKYRSPLVNFLYRMVRDTATAEDLAQEVFLRVYRARKQYSPSAKFTTWLFRIATNLALNSVRDNRYRQMDVSIDAPVEEDEAPLRIARARNAHRRAHDRARPRGFHPPGDCVAAGKAARGGAAA